MQTTNWTRSRANVLILFILILIIPATSIGDDVLPEDFEVTFATHKQTGHIVLTWTGVVGVSHYNIYRKTNPTGFYTALNPNPNPIGLVTTDEIWEYIPDNSREDAMVESILSIWNLTVSDIPNLGRETEEFDALQYLAASNWRIAAAIGQGYYDANVNKNTTYYYEIRAANANGTDKPGAPLASDIIITSGQPILPSAPVDFIAQPGENKVLLLWKKHSSPVAGYIVKRAISPTGPFQAISTMFNGTHFHRDLKDNQTTQPTSYPQINSNGQQVASVVYAATPVGFIDDQRWDEFGNPIPRYVNGNAILGPDNGVTYYYKVAGLDLLKQEGDESNIVLAKPVDQTPPQIPEDVSVTANEVASQLEISWSKVTLDSNGRPETSIAGYQVYCYDDPEDLNNYTQIGSLIPQTQLSIADKDPSLRSTEGVKTYWYRVECIDGEENKSGLSAAVGNHLLDITPPDQPEIFGAKGYRDYIEVEWYMNTESDLDGYMIYRSKCHMGEWIIKSERKKEPLVPFVEVAYIPKDWAEKISNVSGTLKGITTLFEDRDIPEDSTLCYAYHIQAIDTSQNRSGIWPINEKLDEDEYICQRLHDNTPPKSAIISGLYARDGSILIEWIGEPIQDIGAYHVYRSQAESGTYQYRGGRTVEIPGINAGDPLRMKAKPMKAPEKYEGSKACETPSETPTNNPWESPSDTPVFDNTCVCKTIPVETYDGMSHGYFIDTEVESKKIYWYKVVGVDQLGLESTLVGAVPVSTFTFSTKQPRKPVITVKEKSSPCALVISWLPLFENLNHLGFAVFRSETGPHTEFHQLGSIVKRNEYVDKNVTRNKKYWYIVRQIDKNGILSPSSNPASGIVSP